MGGSRRLLRQEPDRVQVLGEGNIWMRQENESMREEGVTDSTGEEGVTPQRAERSGT
jgi:hypothetical protein